MSGEYFDYKEGHIENVSEKLVQLLRLHDYEGVLTPEAIEDFFHLLDDPIYDQEVIFTLESSTLLKMKKALHYLHIAQIYAESVSYLMSGDDDEESFHERLAEDLDVLECGTLNSIESLPVSEYWDKKSSGAREKSDFNSIMNTTDKSPPPPKKDDDWDGSGGYSG